LYTVKPRYTELPVQR